MVRTASKPVSRSATLGRRLDTLAARFDLSMISPDPLELVLRFEDPADQEVAALIAAAFAYGRADIVVRNIGKVLEAMGPSPYGYLSGTFGKAFTRPEALRRFRGFRHRFHKTKDLVALLERISLALQWHGSIGRLFESGYEPKDRDIGPSLDRFVRAMITGPPGARTLDVLEDRALHYLLSAPDDGSACKRMNLFLRWMVRRTSPDLGLWEFVNPSQLIIPLDTHVHRITTFLGLNDRRTPDWKAAVAVTKRLARFDRSDPVRYDFAICRLGILDLCSRQRRKENCDVCLLRDVCRFPVTDGTVV
ncbi:MAG: TIGR02757 family protein [Acidobacteriota bacterium]